MNLILLKRLNRIPIHQSRVYLVRMIGRIKKNQLVAGEKRRNFYRTGNVTKLMLLSIEKSTFLEVLERKII